MTIQELLTAALHHIATKLTEGNASELRAFSLVAAMEPITVLAGAIEDGRPQQHLYRKADDALHSAIMTLRHDDCDPLYAAKRRVFESGSLFAEASTDFGSMSYAELLSLDGMDTGNYCAVYMAAKAAAKDEAKAQVRAAADAYYTDSTHNSDLWRAMRDAISDSKLSRRTTGQIEAGSRRRAEKARDAEFDAKWDALNADPDAMYDHMRQLAARGIPTL